MIFSLYLLFLAAFIFTRGFFSFSGIFILFVFLILMFISLFKREVLQLKLLSPQILLLILCILTLVVYGGLYQQNIILVFASFILLSLNILLSFLNLIDKNQLTHKKIFLSMIGIAILVRLFMVWSSPDPYIDVYDYLKKGALGFIQGQNPYSLTYSKFYENVTPNFYSYLPGMLFLTLPSVILFNDPRYTFILAELLTAIFIYKLIKNKKMGYLSFLLLVNNPVSLYMIEQSYTEPLILLLLVIFAWSFVRQIKYLTVFILGLLLITKQYTILLIPLLLRLFTLARGALVRLGGAILIAGIIILPFFLWNKADFIHDAVTLQYNFPPRYEGLSFFSFSHNFGFNYNFLVSVIIIGTFLLFIYIGKKISLSYFFYLSAFAFFIFFFFNKWAFINYYYLVAQLLLLSAILNDYKI